jgi:hypothetical protein
MSELKFIAYKSKFNHADFGPSELSRIINSSRMLNAAKNITGILVFDGENIFGYIEGQSLDIASLFQKICKDERHLSVKLLSEGELTIRHFKQWDMAYYYLNDDTLSINELMHENVPLESLFKFIKMTDLI